MRDFAPIGLFLSPAAKAPTEMAALQNFCLCGVIENAGMKMADQTAEHQNAQVMILKMKIVIYPLQISRKRRTVLLNCIIILPENNLVLMMTHFGPIPMYA